MGEQSKHEYNERQLKLMLEMISDYERGHLGIGKLIANLEALLLCLEDIENPWQQEFTAQCGKLEDAHAMMLDEGRTTPGETDRDTIARALARLRSLIVSSSAELCARRTTPRL